MEHLLMWKNHEGVIKMEISLRNAVIGIFILVASALIVIATIEYTKTSNAQITTQTDKMFEKVSQ